MKKELYNQINVSRSLDMEKKSLKNQVVMVEEEMQLTIESYKSVLEASELDE